MVMIPRFPPLLIPSLRWSLFPPGPSVFLTSIAGIRQSKLGVKKSLDTVLSVFVRWLALNLGDGRRGAILYTVAYFATVEAAAFLEELLCLGSSRSLQRLPGWGSVG